jgi:hypothetical protein
MMPIATYSTMARRYDSSSLTSAPTDFMDELSLQEVLALKEIHMTGNTWDKVLIRKFVEQKKILDLDDENPLLTYRGFGLFSTRFSRTMGCCGVIAEFD